jgi:hypothetical protein
MMHRMTVLLYLLIPVALFGQEGVTLLRWVGPPGSRPGTYEEWIAEHPYTPFGYTLDRIRYGDARSGSVAILTESDLAQHLSAEIDQFATDLQDEGYTVFCYNITGGTPETLRTFLQQVYSTDSIEGALFIGDLPVPWFEVYDFGGSLAQFPIDLFYMDLNGHWLDTINPGNGLYDGHHGEMKPEIYIGRLTPNGTGVDTLVLRNYFLKDHNYRTGMLDLPKRALVFVDDDWVPWAWQWASDVARLFPDTTSYWDPETTRASLYRTRLDSTQTWVSVFAHSSPAVHQFFFNNYTQTDAYYASEYSTQNPPTSFYNFFACSFCRYTQYGYGGGRAVLNDSYGLGAVGSTKTGSMLDFNYFYQPLSERRTLGQAFKYWFDCIYDSVGMAFDRLCWHYGMTLLGDPFLKPLGHSTTVAESPAYLPAGDELSMKGSITSRQVQMALHLETAQAVRITLYDCTGRRVRELTDEDMTVGTHNMTIELTDNSGRVLPNGVYIIRAAIGNHLFTRKIVKIC